MSEQYDERGRTVFIPYLEEEPVRKKPRTGKVYLNVILFILTFITTLMAGVTWSMKELSLSTISLGFTYSILIMIFISAHEFGHYIASRIHKVHATLPYYIPAPPFIMPFGTFGAVIRTKSPIRTRVALFDIGVAGPIAGFIVCIIFLAYGFATLPGKEFIYEIHPEYLTLYGGEIPKTGLHFGDSIMFFLMKEIFAAPESWVPPMNEIYHYPFLNVGWFGLFVTSLNMLPIGQLDGGHVTHAMFGGRQVLIARVVWWVMFVLGICGIAGIIHEVLLYDDGTGFGGFMKTLLFPLLDWIKHNAPIIYTFWPGWLFWAVITRFFIKIPHPNVNDNSSISKNRMIVGWISLTILVLSFSYNGIMLVD